jgi:hypothetical protein
MKNNTLKIVLLIIFLFVCEVVLSQTPPGRIPIPPGNPIDGGLVILTTVAIGLAANKLRKEK